MKTVKRIIIICAAFGWWGVIYPQFTMVKDTYEIVCEDPSQAKNAVDTGRQADGADIYREVLRADRGQIRFRSRLLKEIRTLQEQRRKIHESGDQ